MWGIFGSGDKRDSKPRIDKEDLERISADTNQLREIIKILNVDLSGVEAQLGTTKKKLKDADALNQSKARLIQLFTADAEPPSSSDLKEALSVKDSLLNKISDMESENARLKSQLEEIHAKSQAAAKADMHDELRVKIAEIAAIVSDSVASTAAGSRKSSNAVPSSHQEGTKFPTDEELRQMVAETDNIGEAGKWLEGVANVIDNYEKLRVSETAREW